MSCKVFSKQIIINYLAELPITTIRKSASNRMALSSVTVKIFKTKDLQYSFVQLFNRFSDHNHNADECSPTVPVIDQQL